MMLEYYLDRQTFFIPVTPENMAGIVELLSCCTMYMIN